MRRSAGSRLSWPFVIMTLVGVGLIALALLLAPDGGSGVPLSPRNSGADGACAVSQVLSRHGVHTSEAATLDAVRRETHGSRTTLLVTDPDDLSPEEFDAARRAAPDSRLVVVTPSPDLRKRLFPDDWQDSQDGLVHPADAQGDVVVINSSGVLANRTIAQGQNARLALRALGARPDVVWISDWHQRTTETQRTGLAWPRWMAPLVWALVLTTLFLVLTRARRFGRLAVEPLPVVVRSIESTRALATLYRRNHARATAADALQHGTVSRLARRLGLPPDARTPEDVLAALPDHLRDLGACLVAAPPRSDEDLVDLARRLAALEKETTRE